MNTKKKILAVLLSVMMIVASFPIMVLQVAAAGNVAEVTVDGVATEYATFEEAYTAAKGKTATIKLLANCDGYNSAMNGHSGAAITSGQITLDLNGYVLKAASSSRAFFIQNGNLTITDSRPDVEHKYVKTTITNIDGNTVSKEILVWDDAATTGDIVTIKGGAITGGVGYKKDKTGPEADLQFRGGGAIYIRSGGSLTINGGVFVGNVATGEGGAIQRDAGTVTINGGTFVGNATVQASGKNLKGKIGINGGTFDEAVTAASGFAVVQDSVTGYYTVATAAAEVIDSENNATGYATFKEAWDAAEAKDNCTVKLLANCSAEHDQFVRAAGASPASFENRGMILSFGKTLTLDLNGFVLTPPTKTFDGQDTYKNIAVAGNSRVIWVHRYATLIVKDSNPTAVHKYVTTDGLYTLDDTNGTITVLGGVITGGNAGTGSLHSGGGAIFVQGGQLIVEGGNFIGNKGTAIKVDGGDKNDLPAEFANKSDKANIAGAITVKGGTFVGNSGKNLSVNNYQDSADRYMWAKSAIAGGIYDKNDEKYGINPNEGLSYLKNDTTGFYNLAAEAAEVIAADGTSKIYSTLKEAWDAAEAMNNCTVKLLKNCSAEHDQFVRDAGASPASFENRGMILGFGKTLTLDLNGFVLTPPTKKVNGDDATGVSRVIWVHRYATLIVKDSNPTAVHKYVDTDGLYTLDDTNGTITVLGGVITGGNAGAGSLHSGGGAIFVQGGQLIVEGGNFIGNKGTAIKVDGGDKNDLPEGFKDLYGKKNIAGAITVKGGTFVGNGGKNLSVSNYQETADRAMWADSEIAGGVFDTSKESFGINPNNGLMFLKNLTTGFYDLKAPDGEASVVEEVTHYMVEIDPGKAATCKEEGKTPTRQCTIVHEGATAACTHTDGGATIEKLQHTIDKWTITKCPSLTEKGEEAQICDTCDEAINTREIAKIEAPANDNAGDNANNNTNTNTDPETEAATTAEEVTTAAPVEEKKGCKSVVLSGASVILVALVGGCVMCRKKED